MSRNPVYAAVREFALEYPGAHEDFPWGERVIKVKGKVFVFMGKPDGELSLSVKLPTSGTWIDESYRAVAPKKLLAELPGTDGASREAKARPPARTRKTAKRPPRKA
jgi:hypothetical protein